MKNILIINLFFLLSFLFLLTSCGGSHSLISSINNSDACFMSYNDKSELEKSLENLTEEIESKGSLSNTLVNITGCLNYQLGNYSVAEKWLTQSFQESVGEAKNTAAYALGVIYLRQSKKDKIEQPHITAAKKNKFGRWMVILYHIDSYLKSQFKKEFLLFAIKEMEEKHQEGGSTRTTERFLEHLKLISKMEDACSNGLKSSACNINSLGEERGYMFASATGFLLMLLKEPPTNNVVLQ